jgi:hypothetical protein
MIELEWLSAQVQMEPVLPECMVLKVIGAILQTEEVAGDKVHCQSLIQVMHIQRLIRIRSLLQDW